MIVFPLLPPTWESKRMNSWARTARQIFLLLLFAMPQEESLELVFRSLPPESSGTVDEITKAIDATLVQRGVDVSTVPLTSFDMYVH